MTMAAEDVRLSDDEFEDYEDRAEFEAAWSDDIRSRANSIVNGTAKMIPASVVFAEADARAAARWA